MSVKKEREKKERHMHSALFYRLFSLSLLVRLFVDLSGTITFGCLFLLNPSFIARCHDAVNKRNLYLVKNQLQNKNIYVFHFFSFTLLSSK